MDREAAVHRIRANVNEKIRIQMIVADYYRDQIDACREIIAENPNAQINDSETGELIQITPEELQEALADMAEKVADIEEDIAQARQIKTLTEANPQVLQSEFSDLVLDRLDEAAQAHVLMLHQIWGATELAPLINHVCGQPNAN